MDEVKVLEHTFFEANLEDAFEFLGTVKGALTYKHFLKVDHILFSDFTHGLVKTDCNSAWVNL